MRIHSVMPGLLPAVMQPKGAGAAKGPVKAGCAVWTTISFLHKVVCLRSFIIVTKC